MREGRTGGTATSAHGTVRPPAPGSRGMAGVAPWLLMAVLLALCQLSTVQAALAGTRDRELELSECFGSLGDNLGPFYESQPAQVAEHGGPLYAYLSQVGFDAQPISFAMDDDLNVMSATVHFNYLLTWDDPRVKNETFGCSDLLLPHLLLTMFGAALPTTTTNVFFLLDQPQHATPDSVTMYVAAKATLYLWEWTYDYYPYDKHWIPLHFVVGQGSSVALLNCVPNILTVHDHFDRGRIDLHEYAATHGLDIIEDKDAEKSLVGGDGGPSSAYGLDRDYEGDGEWLQVYQFEFLEGTSHTCAIDIAVARKPNVFVIKSMLMDFLIAFAGLLALFIDFTIPPMLGGRAGVLMTSMLMTVNSSVKRDLGVGNLDYMVIVDYIGLLNTLILATALFETLVVYSIHRRGSSTFATNVDTKIAPAAICAYCLYAIGFILLLATQNPTVATVYGVCVAIIITAAVICSIVSARKKRLAKFDKMATEICAQPGGITDFKVLEKAFKLFDTDNSGTLEWDELTVLIRAVQRQNGSEFTNTTVVEMLREADLNAEVIQKSGIGLSDLRVVLAPTESLMGGNETTDDATNAP